MGRHVRMWRATCGIPAGGGGSPVSQATLLRGGARGLFLPCVPYNPTGILSVALPRGPGVAPEYHQTGEGALQEALNPPSRQTSGGIRSGQSP